MTRTIWRWVERAVVLAALLSLLSYGVLEVWFLETAPRNPGSGAVHAIKWHGTTVYLTDAHQLETDTLFWVGPVLLLVALGLNLWVKFRN
jgi:hypothetical protein